MKIFWVVVWFALGVMYLFKFNSTGDDFYILMAPVYFGISVLAALFIDPDDLP